MVTRYVIQSILTNLLWSGKRGIRFGKSYLDAVKFESEEELLGYAQKEAIGVFKIMKIYDTK